MDYLMPSKQDKMPSEQDIEFVESNIETIDLAFHEWVDKNLNISTNSNKGWKKVPVLWQGQERAFQVKNEKELRDSVGKLILPMITINRESISKNPQFQGAMQAHFPPTSEYKGDYKGGSIAIARRIKQDKTRDFINNDFRKSVLGKTKDDNNEYTGRVKSKKIVYEEVYIPIPVHVTVMYTITLRSEYQQQMNSMVTPFITRIGNINGFTFGKDNNKYEGFIEADFSDSTNRTNLSEEERKFETKVTVKVLGYLIGDGPNNTRPKVTVRENKVEVRISRERVIMDDRRPWAKDDGKYRE